MNKSNPPYIITEVYTNHAYWKHIIIRNNIIYNNMLN